MTWSIATTSVNKFQDAKADARVDKKLPNENIPLRAHTWEICTANSQHIEGIKEYTVQSRTNANNVQMGFRMPKDIKRVAI
jgi:hypothetical protein